MIPETERIAAAEQQVRETLGWCIHRTSKGEFISGVGVLYNPARPHEINAYNALVSKTAELLEMTAQRDSFADYCQHWESRAESAEATIREQAERIKELRQSLLDVKALLGGAEYSVGRSDGRPFDLPEAIRIGNIFEKADKAIEASNER